MSVSAQRNVTILMDGDFSVQMYENAAANTTSPAVVLNTNLQSGTTTLTPPASATGLTILPPSGNVDSITVKGASGDTGIVIHPTDPTSIGIASTNSDVLLTATTTINNVRLVWS